MLTHFPAHPRTAAWLPMLVALAMLLMAGSAMAASGVTSTVANEGGACKNGDGVPNCNKYSSKDDVYLSAISAQGNGSLDDGDYYFAVLDPGAQNQGAADGDSGNLSDDFDTAADREFTLTDGVLSLNGNSTHDTGTLRGGTETVLQAAPFADGTNNGGVYVLAICKAGSADPKDCKFDNFKVDDTPPCDPETEECEPPCDPLVDEGCEADPAAALEVLKSAVPALDRTYPWSLDKSVADSTLEGSNTVTADYTVDVTRGDGADSNYTVSGIITVANPNDGEVTGVSVADDILDETGDTCVVDAGPTSIAANSAEEYTYTCTYASAPAAADQTNQATVDWPAQDVGENPLAAGPATGTAPVTWADAVVTEYDACATVTDVFGSLAAVTLNEGDLCDSASFPYQKTIAVAQNCTVYNNTATVTPADGGPTDDDSESVTVCGPLGHTMGFWQNPNGQALIKGAGTANGACKLATWLRGYAPFQDLSATATCATTAKYVNDVIKVAKCGLTDKTCNTMLKGQMLATALAVYFTDPAKGGPLWSPAWLGPYPVNTTAWAAAFNGTPMTVSDMLTWAAGKSNVGGSIWYGQVKATQVLAKSAFDAINNNIAPAG